MRISFEQVSDTLGNISGTAQDMLGGETPNSQLNVVSDEEMHRRKIIRIMVVVAVLGVITYFIYKKIKK